MPIDPTPDFLFNSFHTGLSGNAGGYSNPVVDRALEAMLKTADTDEQDRLAGAIQEQLAKDIAFIPVVFDVVAQVSSSAIGPAPDPDPRNPLSLATTYRRKR